MKKILTILILLSAFAAVFAQEYPEVSIKDINYHPADTLIYYGQQGGEPAPNYLGDTVWVTGVVMCSPYLDNSAPMDSARLRAGAPAIFLQDTAEAEWGGVLTRDPGAHDAFAFLDSGLVIRALGVVVEYYTTTEFDIIEFDASNVIGFMDRPEPVQLTLDSLVTDDSEPTYTAEKWEGAFVEVHNLRVVGDAIGSNSYFVIDDDNRQITIYTKGQIYRDAQQPLPNTKIESVRGFVETRTNAPGWYMINPVYPEDVVYGDVSPPNIMSVRRDEAAIGLNQAVEVTARILDGDGTADVVSADLYYAVDDGEFQSVSMSIIDDVDSVWSGTIPGLSSEALVKYYIQAIDADDAESNSPGSYEERPYFYLVLDRDPVLSDVQYSPFGSGFSAFNGYEVTVSGVVTADTTDIEGDNANISPQVYIQDGNQPWSAIQIFGTEADVLRRGDSVTVSGFVNENFGVTRIGNLTEGAAVTVHSSGNALPEPVIVSTDEVGDLSDGQLPAESYEGMLIKYQNITVADENAAGNAGPDEGSGGNRNFGEMLVVDKSGTETRLEMQDGTHDYHNFWDASQESEPIRVTVEDTFESISGILFYSFGDYKLVPRKNDDFQGHVVVGIEEQLQTTVTSYSLEQNYPNPFNPETKIRFSLPESGNVRLAVYNVLGQEVMELVSGMKSAGAYEVSFDASELPSGIYLYRYSVNNFQTVKKMMLLK